MRTVNTITGSFADYYVLSRKKKFCCERKLLHTVEIYLVLYQCFVKETAPKCGCLVDLFATILLAMIYMHIFVFCFKN